MSGTSLTRIHVSSGKQETVRDFAADLKEWRPVLVLSRAEGSPSLDGKTMAFLVEEEGTFKVRGMFVYDVAANRITARHDLRGESDQLRNVTISPTGRFVVAAFEACATEALGTMASPCGLMSYDRDFKTARGLARAVAELDVAFDEKYREVVLFQSLERDQINSVEIASGTTVDLTPAGFSKEQGLGLHFSGRALWKPGWGLVSASTDEPRGNWMEDLLFFMELKKGGRVVPIGHHRSRRQREGDDYFAEPHATVNRTATRVLFSSNWGKLGSLDLDTYEVQLAPDWAARVVAK